MIELGREFVDLALSRLEAIAQGQHHVGVGVVAVRLVRGDDRLVPGHADLDADMKKLRPRGAPRRRLDNDTGMRKPVEMALQPLELFPDAGFDRIASLEAVERDLEWFQHARTLS